MPGVKAPATGLISRLRLRARSGWQRPLGGKPPDIARCRRLGQGLGQGLIADMVAQEGAKREKERFSQIRASCRVSPDALAQVEGQR